MTLKKIAAEIDKKALCEAVGLMLMSWAALPVVYWLIVRKKQKGEEKKNDKQNN